MHQLIVLATTWYKYEVAVQLLIASCTRIAIASYSQVVFYSYTRGKCKHVPPIAIGKSMNIPDWLSYKMLPIHAHLTTCIAVTIQ